MKYTKYAAERLVRLPAEPIWKVLSDLSHIARNDPYHHDFKFVEGSLQEGKGATFITTHSYWPIFPFPRDEVVCKVIDWQPLARVTVVEKSQKKYRSHIQDFTLEPCGQYVTVVHFEVNLFSIPWWLWPLRAWVTFKALRRMRQKLKEVEEAAWSRYLAERSRAV